MTNPPEPVPGHDQTREVARLEAEYSFDPGVYAYELADALSGLAVALDVAGDKGGARAHFDRAVSIARDAYQRATPGTGDIRAHEDLLTHLFNFIQFSLKDGDAVDAITGADEALALLDAVATEGANEGASEAGETSSEAADDTRTTAGRALYLDFRGTALSMLGRNAESLEAHSEAALMLALSHDAYPQQVEFLERQIANRMAKVIENEDPEAGAGAS
jgi:tetratricopeptide (TPR) repeat protein